MTVMCGHGERAMSAASILEARGASELRVLVGGPDDWAAHTGRPLDVE
jgi:hydroxyacylglutathione hydrolase